MRGAWKRLETTKYLKGMNIVLNFLNLILWFQAVSTSRAWFRCGFRDFPSAVHFCFDHFWQWLGCAGLNTVFGTCLQTGRCQSHTTRSGAKACPMDRGVECKFGATQNVTLMHPQKTECHQMANPVGKITSMCGAVLVGSTANVSR